MYKGIMQLVSAIPEGDYLELYYFVLKTTPGVFRIHPPVKCRVRLVGNHRKYVEFSYLTKAGNWSTTKSSYLKNNSFYYATLQEAEEGFKKEIEFAKEVFTNEINRANIALNDLAKY
jgi:galactokinase